MSLIGVRRALLSSGAPKPTLSLNFISTTALDPRITFSRASTAYYTNAAGVLTAASSNVPRFDYSPTSIGTPLGLLIEGQATNLFLNSKADGTSLSTQSITTSATPYTISFYGTGTITLTGTATATITGTGVYPSRKTYTFTPTAGTLTATVSGTVQYAQAETGSFATSYIPTGATTATRAADSATMTGSNFSSWYNLAQGTFVVGADTVRTTGQATVSVADDGTSSNRIMLYLSALVAVHIVTTGGSNQSVLSSSALSASTPFKIAGSYKSAGFQISTNGGGYNFGSTGTVPSVNQLGIGGDSAETALSGHLRTLTYYPTALSAATLQSLTQ